MGKMRELYSFIRIPFRQREELLVKMHMEEPSSSDGVGKEEYYSTYRSVHSMFKTSLHDFELNYNVSSIKTQSQLKACLLYLLVQ